jgi:hypothetical protein
MELDIDRASWVAEMALEWSREEGGVIPDALIERLSQNLFVDDKVERSSLSAIEALAAALVKNSASARLKLGDAELTLDHKGLKRLDDTASS